MNENRVFIEKDVLERFLRYVIIDTTADEASKKCPSSQGQKELACLLEKELRELGLSDVQCDLSGYVYGTLKASDGVKSPAITFCAHMDTSPSEPGKDIRPRLHENYQGGEITYPDDPDLKLTPDDSPALEDYKGDTIITASGKTLLGADDKAGIAEIMTALACFHIDKELLHPELRIVFTPDEEIGRGTDRINIKRLGKFGYTVDGSRAGEIEDECFDAWKVEFIFNGVNVHPGFAKGKMLNAAEIAARFISQIPEYETPAHTEKREGFFHLTGFSGEENSARFAFILRDFEEDENRGRIAYLTQLKEVFGIRYPGLKIEMKTTQQYQNMLRILEKHPCAANLAVRAIRNVGLTPLKAAIRGGTDGARLCYKGIPTPNLFAGGHLFHSKKEWIALGAMVKATETIVELSRLWAEETEGR